MAGSLATNLFHHNSLPDIIIHRPGDGNSMCFCCVMGDGLARSVVASPRLVRGQQSRAQSVNIERDWSQDDRKRGVANDNRPVSDSYAGTWVL